MSPLKRRLFDIRGQPMAYEKRKNETWTVTERNRNLKRSRNWFTSRTRNHDWQLFDQDVLTVSSPSLLVNRLFPCISLHCDQVLIEAFEVSWIG